MCFVCISPAMFPHGNVAFFQNLQNLEPWDAGYFYIRSKWLKPPNMELYCTFVSCSAS